MRYLKLKEIFQECQNETWLGDNGLDNELRGAMDCCMPHVLFDQALDLIDELRNYKAGDVEHEDMFVMIDVDNFYDGMRTAYETVMEKRSASIMEMLNALPGNDEVERSPDEVASLLDFLDG